MSLHKLKLNPLNISELYSHSLVNSIVAKDSTIPKNTHDIVFKGGNANNIVVLVNDKIYPFIADVDLALLQKIIGACGLTMNDIALVNIHKQQITFQNITTQLMPKIALLFDIKSEDIDLPIIFQEYKTQVFDNVTIIRSNNLQTLADNADFRKSLWNCIRVLFNK